MLWTLIGAVIAAAGVVLLLPGPGAIEAFERPATASGDTVSLTDPIESLWLGPEAMRLGASLPLASGEQLDLGGRVSVMPTPGAAVLLGMGLLITLRRPRSRPPAPASAPKLNTLSNAALA